MRYCAKIFGKKKNDYSGIAFKEFTQREGICTGNFNT